jgi:hypothetical protein
MTAVLEPLSLDVLDAAPPAVLAAAGKDAAPNRCQADGCDNTVPKPARGRPPKFCTDHKSGAKPAGTPSSEFNTAKSSLSGKSWPKAAEVETLLKKYVETIGIGISFVHEKDGKVIIEGGPDVVTALVELAKDERQLRKYLEWLTTPGKYAPLTLAVAGIVIPIMSNHGLIQLDLRKVLGTPEGGN